MKYNNLSKYLIFTALVSCTMEKQTVVETILKYADGQESEISVAPSGEETTLAFYSNGSWDASTTANWLDLERISGIEGDNILKVKIDENLDTRTSERKTVVRITSSSKVLEFQIIQALNGQIIIEGETEGIELPDAGGKYTVNFSSTKAWTATSDSPWLTVSNAEGNAGKTCSVTVSAAVNTDQDRNGSITIQCDEQTSQLVKFSQKKVTSTLILADGASSDLQLRSVESDAQLKFLALESWSATTDSEWITLSSEQGQTGPVEYTVNVAANDGTSREGVVTISPASGMDGLRFTISQNSLQADYVGTWTASGKLTDSNGTVDYSEDWVIEYDSEDDQYYFSGLLGEAKYPLYTLWSDELNMLGLETGGDNWAGIYNFGLGGLHAIAPIYSVTYPTKSLSFYSYTQGETEYSFPFWLKMSEDAQSLTPIVKAYDTYPNPTKFVYISSGFSITYGLYVANLTTEGELESIGDFVGYTYGGKFQVTSVVRNEEPQPAKKSHRLQNQNSKGIRNVKSVIAIDKSSERVNLIR